MNTIIKLFKCKFFLAQIIIDSLNKARTSGMNGRRE